MHFVKGLANYITSKVHFVKGLVNYIKYVPSKLNSVFAYRDQRMRHFLQIKAALVVLYAHIGKGLRIVKKFHKINLCI